LPYFRATHATLADRLEDLVRSESLRREWAEAGNDYVERWHSYPAVAALALEAYADAAARKGLPFPGVVSSASCNVRSADATPVAGNSPTSCRRTS
jgi:hypothetical protein